MKRLRKLAAAAAAAAALTAVTFGHAYAGPNVEGGGGGAQGGTLACVGNWSGRLPGVCVNVPPLPI